MPLEAVLAFSLFALVASITPGPNNFMLLASGMNFGFKASIPHMLGISVGFFLMTTAVGSGLAALFARYPVAYSVMKWVSVIYLLYLAWRIAIAGTVSDEGRGQRSGKPLGFLGAALFQWVNPKAWVIAISAFSTYVPSTAAWLLVVAIAGLFAVIGLPCISSWALFGTALRRWLRQPRYARMFNFAMAALLVASLLPMLETF